MRRKALLTGCIAVALTGVCWGGPLPGKQPGAVAPARKQTPVVVPQLSLPDEVGRAVEQKSLKPAIEPLEKKLVDLLRLKTPTETERDALLTTAAGLQFVRYFSRLEITEPEPFPDAPTWDALRWLASRPRFASQLMLSLGPTDAPDRVMELVKVIRDEEGKNRNADDWASLASAMVLVWDDSSTEERGDEADKPNVLQATLLYRYYTNAGARLKFDAKTLPFELLTYTVDTPLDRDEIVWALDQYGKRSAVGGVYFDVPYDTDALFVHGDRAISGKPYTLPNLVRIGGVCVDQAYFATMVGRAMGIPSTPVVGRGNSGDGIGHAWVGYLESTRDRTVWNFTDGRYEAHLYFRGEAFDPQLRQRISEVEVALTAESLRFKPTDRLLSSALTNFADLLEIDERAALFMRAIDLYPGNRGAWQALAQMGAKRTLQPSQMQQLGDAVGRYMVKAYPDFAMELLRTTNSGRGTAQQDAALVNMKPMFAHRPDLVAELTLAQGDLARQEKQFGEALRLYGSVIDRNPTMGPLVMMAMDRIDPLMRERGEVARLAGVYGDVWARMPRVDVTAFVQTTPYYQIGKRYSQLLAEVGTQTALNERSRVEARLESLDSSAAAGR